MAVSAQTPTSSTAKRVARIMHRGEQTKWNEKEIRAFRKLLPIPEEDLAAVERMYKYLWPPSTGKNVLRHDLGTLINNWSGEVDRAKIWLAKQAAKPQYKPRVIIPLPAQVETEATEEERKLAAEQFQALMGRAPKLNL